MDSRINWSASEWYHHDDDVDDDMPDRALCRLLSEKYKKQTLYIWKH